MSYYNYDFLVIGGGSAGVRAARRAASLGYRTALFESQRLGGTCVLKGCIPKKLMVYGAQFIKECVLASEYGWKTSDKQFLDWDFQNTRRAKELIRLSYIYEKLLTDSGVTIIPHKACLGKGKTVLAGGKTYQAPRILIAVGGQPYTPDWPGVEHALVSDNMFQLRHFPRSLIVVGAGYIALEFAGIFQSIGASVTVLSRGDKVLRGFDQDVRSFFQQQAQAAGLNIVHHFQPERIVQGHGASVYERILSIYDSCRKSFDAEHILLAVGRKPWIEPLNLESCGVKLAKNGRIQVSSQFETTAEGIYALGDCADTPFQLTPTALAEAEALVQNLFAGKNKKVNYQFVPSAVFSNPPIAVVGWTEEQAKQKGFQVKVFESQFRPLKYTIIPEKREYPKIYMKMIVDAKTDRVLGCHIVGEEAPEIIQGVAIALTAGASKADFDNTIGLHPSTAEELCTMRTSRD